MSEKEWSKCDCIISQSDKVDSCHYLTKGEEEHHSVIFEEEFIVAHNQLLNEWREEGFEVFSFGNNFQLDPSRCTARFVKSDRE